MDRSVIRHSLLHEGFGKEANQCRLCCAKLLSDFFKSLLNIWLKSNGELCAQRHGICIAVHFLQNKLLT